MQTSTVNYPRSNLLRSILTLLACAYILQPDYHITYQIFCDTAEPSAALRVLKTKGFTNHWLSLSAMSKTFLFTDRIMLLRYIKPMRIAVYGVSIRSEKVLKWRLEKVDLQMWMTPLSAYIETFRRHVWRGQSAHHNGVHLTRWINGIILSPGRYESA